MPESRSVVEGRGLFFKRFSPSNSALPPKSLGSGSVYSDKNSSDFWPYTRVLEIKKKCFILEQINAASIESLSPLT